MTNEEAIDLLRMIEFENAECNLGTWYHGIDGDMKEALEMAIKVLEQELCTDAISRTRLKEVFHRNVVCGEVYDELIDAQPSVRVAEKVGYWIDTGSGQECSECHEIQYGYDNHRFYCPNCGAKMREVEKNEKKRTVCG